MTFTTNASWWVKVQRQDHRTALTVAIGLHVLVFLLGTRIFVKSVQFSVQSGPQSTEVSLVDMAQPPAPETMPAPQPAPEKKEVAKTSQEIQQGVKVQANPNYFQNPAPPYPELAKQMHQEGLVLLAVDVNREGEPVKVDIAQSCGFRLLDQAAQKAVSSWKFQPGRIGDLPVESQVTVPIRFRLQDITR